MESKATICLLLLFASISTTTSFESDALTTRRHKRDADQQPSLEPDGELLQRSHRDGRRTVTPDPSVNVENFNFSATDHHDVVANASQLSRRRNLKRRLERYRQNRGRGRNLNETSADQGNEELRNRNSTRRRRNRRRGGLTGWCGSISAAPNHLYLVIRLCPML